MFRARDARYLLTLAMLVIAPAAGRGSAAAASDAPWTEVNTPHFVVVGNTPAKELRGIALELERTRAVYLRASGVRVDGGRPLIVLVTHDNRFWNRFAANDNRQKNWVGQAARGQQKEYLAVRPSTSLGPFSLLRSMYAGHVVELNYAWAPYWLGNGFTSVLSRVAIEDRKARLGGASIGYPRSLFLYGVSRDTRSVTLEDLLNWKPGTLKPNDPKLPALLVAADSLVHRLLFVKEPGHPIPLNDVMRRLEDGMDSEQALEQVLGDKSTVRKKFASGEGDPTKAFILPAPAEVPLDQVPIRTMSPAEVSALEGDFLLQDGKLPEARICLEEAIRIEPNLAVAHVTLGLLSVREGKLDEARRHVADALRLEPSNYLGHYALGLAMPADKPSGDEIIQAAHELTEAIRLRPDFAPALKAMAELLVQHGHSLQDRDTAVTLARRAVSLEPSNPDYTLVLARALAAAGKTEAARLPYRIALGAARDDTTRNAALAGLKELDANASAGTSANAPVSGQTSDTHPAADSTQATPWAQSPEQGPLLKRRPGVPRELSSVEGKITQVNCSGFQIRLSVEKNGQSLALESEDYVAVPFYDDLHQDEGLKPCTELLGHNAYVTYRPRAAGTEAEELVSVLRLTHPPATTP